MNFTVKTYRKARNRIIDRLVKASPSSQEFENAYILGIKIVERGRREKGLW